MMTRGDQDGDRRISAHYFRSICRHPAEAELRLHVGSAESRLVDDGSKSNAAAEMRQQHGAREIARTDDVETGDRLRQTGGGTRLGRRTIQPESTVVRSG